MSEPFDPQRAFNEATRHQKAGRLEAAERLYRGVVAAVPGHAESHHRLGLIALRGGRGEAAVALIEKAISLSGTKPVAAFHHAMGMACRGVGRLDDAATHFQRVTELEPGLPDAHNNLGLAVYELGRLGDAAKCYQRVLALTPESVEATTRLAAILREQGRLDEAEACCRRALFLDPANPDALSVLGIVLKEQGRLDEAAACYERVLAVKPDDWMAHYNFGGVLKEQGRLDDALAAHRRALELKPDSPEARIALCTAQLPPLYADAAEIAVRRAAYRSQLEALEADIGVGISARDLAKGVGSSQPFYLAYQGENDRELQALYGRIVCGAMAALYPQATLPPPPASGEPVRVGMVSGYFWTHSNWKIPIKGWLSRLDRKKFQLFAYHTGSVRDPETKAATALCHRFVQGPLALDRWRETILADAPHVLIYPEIGMDPMAARLAAQRLAPVQCNSWGHPDTSGFPTMDYYLSADAMEPADGQDHYTETLVRLPKLSIYYEPSAAPQAVVTRQELGFRTAATIYWCGQSLYKYLPQFDDIFPRIGQGAGDCQFAFIEFPGSPRLTDLFRQRLDRAFAAFGLNAADYCVFLPRLEPGRFATAIGQCDIVLDSIGWSGCNSTLESLVHNRPVVTHAGPFMRGRHGAGILTGMGVTDTIATTIDDYVSIAVRLAHDVAWRTALGGRISERKHLIYRDDSCIAALEAFLDRVARDPARAGGGRRLSLSGFRGPIFQRFA